MGMGSLRQHGQEESPVEEMALLHLRMALLHLGMGLLHPQWGWVCSVTDGTALGMWACGVEMSTRHHGKPGCPVTGMSPVWRVTPNLSWFQLMVRN